MRWGAKGAYIPVRRLGPDLPNIPTGQARVLGGAEHKQQEGNIAFSTGADIIVAMGPIKAATSQVCMSKATCCLPNILSLFWVHVYMCVQSFVFQVVILMAVLRSSSRLYAKGERLQGSLVPMAYRLGRVLADGAALCAADDKESETRERGVKTEVGACEGKVR